MGGGANAGDFQIRAVDHGEQTTVFHIMVPHQFLHGQDPAQLDYLIDIAYQPNSPDGWELEGENNEAEYNLPWSASADPGEPLLRLGNQTTPLPTATRKFTVERMIESEGGAAVEEEDEHTVMFVVFTPGLLIRAHHSAAYTSSGAEIDRPEDDERSYAAFVSVPDAGGDAPEPPLDGSHSYVKLNLEFRANSAEVDDGLITLTLPDHIRAWDENEEELPQVTLVQIVTGGEAHVADGPESMAALASGGVDIWVQFDPAAMAAADLAEAVELTYELAFADGAAPATVNDEVLIQLVAIFGDTNRDGTVDLADLEGKGTFTNESGAVYVVNYHHYKARTHPTDGRPVEDAIKWIASDDPNHFIDGVQQRRISPHFEEWIITGDQDPDLFTPIHVTPLHHLEEDVAIVFRVPDERPDDARAFHMYVVDRSGADEPEYIPVWGGFGHHSNGEWPDQVQGANTRGHKVIIGPEVDVTKWLNPESPEYQETRDLSDGDDAVYEFVIEGIIFRDMPFPGADGFGRYDGTSVMFDGVVNIGLELRAEDEALGEVDWVQISYCGIPPGDETGNPVPVLAFQGSDDVLTAQGFGKHAQGGRYGHVFTVTTNQDPLTGGHSADANSLRYALESPVPRTVIFALDPDQCVEGPGGGGKGTIWLQQRLRVHNP